MKESNFYVSYNRKFLKSILYMPEYFLEYSASCIWRATHHHYNHQEKMQTISSPCLKTSDLVSASEFKLLQAVCAK